MISGILLACLAATIYGFLGISFEIAAKRRYPIWEVLLYKQFTGFVIGLVCSVALGSPLFDSGLLMLGSIGAVSYVVTCSSYLRASRERNIASNWTIVNLSVALPLILSVFWFGDAFGPVKAVGVVFTLISIVLVGGGFKGLSWQAARSEWLPFIAIAFLLNGVLVILFRFVPEDRGALFTAYFYGISFLLVLPWKIFRNPTQLPPRGLLGVATLGAVTHWSGIMLTVAALHIVGRVSSNAGVVVYPITNGLVIPIGVLLGVLLLKQGLDGKARAGVACGMVALVCLFL